MSETSLWWNRESLLRSLFWITVSLYSFALALPILSLLRSGSPDYALYPCDDFYYYYLTAKHFAVDGFSSFDGLIKTNGYHPLWFLCLSAVCVVFRDDRSAFFFVTILQFASTIVTAKLLLSLFQKLYQPSKWQYVVVLVCTYFTSVLMYSGMETVLALPLYLLFLLNLFEVYQKPTAPQAFRGGLFGSLLVLSRLDTLTAVGLAILVLLVVSRRLRPALWMTAGLFPVLLYLLSNKVFFASWLPVSAQVKQLSTEFNINVEALSFFRTRTGLPMFLLTLVGCALSIRAWLQHKASAVRMLLFIAAIVFLVILISRESWGVYAWYFYMYPVVAAAAVLECVEAIRLLRTRRIDYIAPIGMLAISVYLTFISIRSMANTHHDVPADPMHPYTQAKELKAFALSHPGRYAMGDRAGVMEFLIGQPILQLEGLVANQAYVDSFRLHADLLNVLKHYGVQYYIASEPLSDYRVSDSAWHLCEPHPSQLLMHSPRLETICITSELYHREYKVDSATSREGNWVVSVLDISHAHKP